MHYHRPLVLEDVETARSHLDSHVPLEFYAGPAVCASAAHTITAPVWPCSRYRWARNVLDAHARGEIRQAALG